MIGEEYKRRCQGLGYSTDVLAKILGISGRGLRERWHPEARIRTEAVLALEALEHRRMIYSYDIAMRRRVCRADLEMGPEELAFNDREESREEDE